MSDASHHAPSRDAADYREASSWPDPADRIDKTEDVLAEAFLCAARTWPGDLPRTKIAFECAVVQIFRAALGTQADPETGREANLGALGLLLAEQRAQEVSREGAAILLNTIAIVLDSNNAQLTADCLAFAAGLHSLQGGVSEDSIAEKYDLGRAAVSKRVTQYQRQLGLPTSAGMKPEAAQDVYRERAHKVHGTTADGAKKAPSIIAAIGRIRQWFGGVRRDGVDVDQLAEVRKQFQPLKEIIERIYDDGWAPAV